MQLDTTYSVNTPEGIALQLSPAGVVPRLLAWSIDLLLRSIIIAILSIALFFSLGTTGMGIALIVIFLLEWFYPVYFELRQQGQTPGKKVMGLYVAHSDASPVTPAASLLRNVLRFVDFLPALYGFAFVSMLFNRRFQRLGDLAADTVVLHKNPPHTPYSLPPVDPIRPATSLTLPEQQAILLFAQRSPSLAAARQAELASLTGALVANADDPAQRLHGIANWIGGGKA